MKNGLRSALRTSRQAMLSSAPTQATRGDSILSSRPPTACFSPSHAAALGHDESPGRTRRLDVPVGPFVAFAGDLEEDKALPSRGVTAACLSKVLLFILRRRVFPRPRPISVITRV